MRIGDNIRFLRHQNHFTQEQLAEHLRVSYQAVSKWETNASTPDIFLLPKLAHLFHVSIDTLFSDDISSSIPEDLQAIKDDDVIRIVQMRGRQILRITPAPSQDSPPIEIVFPHDCNDKTQYFRVEIFGHVISDSSINGDVICHQSLQCATINGDVRTDGDIQVHEINASGKLTCHCITDCYRLQCHTIACTGHVNSANLTCAQIIQKEQA